MSILIAWRPANRQAYDSPVTVRQKWARRFVSSVVLLVLTAPTAVLAGDMSAVPMSPADRSKLSSVLDGRTFQGELGSRDNGSFENDIWTFQQGMFLSQSCEKCGYPESPYWVRYDGDDVLFRAETVCPKTAATIVWEGVVRDGGIEGTYTWTKERWYWTVQKEFWFKGSAAVALNPGNRDDVAPAESEIH